MHLAFATCYKKLFTKFFMGCIVVYTSNQPYECSVVDRKAVIDEDDIG